MDTDIGALTIIFSEFYYWVTVPLMFLIQGDCPIPSVTSTAHPRSSASR
jgi:ammonium transporter, Amt family